MEKVESNNSNFLSLYACHLCDLSYKDERQLLEHKKNQHHRILKKVLVKKRNRMTFNIGQFQLHDPVDWNRRTICPNILSTSSSKPRAGRQKKVECTGGQQEEQVKSLDNNNDDAGQNSTLTKDDNVVVAVVEDNNSNQILVMDQEDKVTKDEPRSLPTNNHDEESGENNNNEMQVLENSSSRRKQQIQSRTFRDDDDDKTVEVKHEKKVDCSLASALALKAGRTKVMLAKTNGLEKMKMRVAKMKQIILKKSKSINEKDTPAPAAALKNCQKQAIEKRKRKVKRFIYSGDLSEVINAISTTTRPVRMSADPMKIFEDSPPSSPRPIPPSQNGHQNTDHKSKTKLMSKKIVAKNIITGNKVDAPPTAELQSMSKNSAPKISTCPAFLEKLVRLPSSVSLSSNYEIEMDESRMPKRGRPPKSNTVTQQSPTPANGLTGHVVGVEDRQDDPPNCSTRGRVRVRSKKYDDYFCDTNVKLVRRGVTRV